MTPGARVERVVRRVCSAAVRDTAAAGIIVLDDWSPEGELVYEWLVREFGEERVWRAASVASNLHAPEAGGARSARAVPGTGDRGDRGGRDTRELPDSRDVEAVAALRAAREQGALVAHPVNRTALLLGGRPPWADLLPLGDVWASQVERLTGRWSAPANVEACVAAAGGVGALDEALSRLLDRREAERDAVRDLPEEAAAEVLRLYARGRPFRLRPRVVPKLSARTLGIDLFD
jgi:hypothetical protein